MPTELGFQFLPDWVGVPPHMSKIDFEIWKRVKDEVLKNSIAVYYDVKLGTGRIPLGVTDVKEINLWRRLNQKRADVIIEFGTEIKIIELRDNAKLDTIGRLVGYGLLYDSDPPFDKPVKLLIITNLQDNDVQMSAEKLGIEYLVR